MQPDFNDSTRSMRLCWLALVGACVLAGAILRLVWLDDMEWKLDEQWTYDRVRFAAIEPTPWLGMPTSYDVRHPPGTVWVFQALGWLVDARSPVELARATATLNVLAVLAMIAYARWLLPRSQRETWYWAAALAAVNPVGVLLQRKIWPPSVLPAFVILLLIAWQFRHRRVGALAWGAMGPILGQVHPVGLFVAAGLVGWAGLFDRRQVRWGCWAIGSAVALVPLVPWLEYALAATADCAISQRTWINACTPKFWLRCLTEPFGFDARYALGRDFPRLLSKPEIGGVASWGLGVVHALLLAGCLSWWCCLGWRILWQRQSLHWTDPARPTEFTLGAALVGFAAVFALSGLPMHRHYMLAVFPLPQVLLATTLLRWTRWGRAWLALLVLGQLAVCVGCLHFIHTAHRPISGDYGTPYSVQVAPAAKTFPEGSGRKIAEEDVRSGRGMVIR